MYLKSTLLVLGIIFGITAGASTAQAAKGIKKKANPNVEHHHQGKVVHVDHKSGRFTIAVVHHSKKKKAAAANPVTKIVQIRFSVSKATQFSIGSKKMKAASNFAALQVGEYVSVAGKNHHADAVLIHKGNKRQNIKKPKKLK